MLGHAFILVGNGDSSCNVRDYGSYAGGETWCAVYINSNANIAETNGLVCVSSLDIMDRMEAAAKQNQLERLQYENMELKEALEEERSFSDRLLEGIDRVLDMLERHLPRQLLHLVDKARELLPEHQTYRQQQQRERGHSWDDMSL